MNENAVRTYYHDAGHGWLEVPVADLLELGVADKISSCSYVNNGMAYLEEDCDVGTYYKAFEDKYGYVPLMNATSVDHGHTSPIREYRSYVKSWTMEDWRLYMKAITSAFE